MSGQYSVAIDGQWRVEQLARYAPDIEYRVKPLPPVSVAISTLARARDYQMSGWGHRSILQKEVRVRIIPQDSAAAYIDQKK